MSSDAPEFRQAVLHVLRRVQTDPEFRYHMLHTESFDLLCGAIAPSLGLSFEEVKDLYSEDRQPEYQRRDAQCWLDRKRVQELELQLEELASESGLNDVQRQTDHERVQKLERALEEIVAMDGRHTYDYRDEWTEAESFHAAREKAKEALKK